MVCSLSMGLHAQTQKGFVKTRGRLTANGTVIAGSRLAGATVTLGNGRSGVSGANGAFSLAVPSKKFFLQNVTKNNYVLCDPEVLKKQYDYSANDLVLVMEDEKQRQADINTAVRNIRNTLTAQLKAREDEIEALNASNEEKQRLISQLYEQQERNEKLIREMAERYVKIDYDSVDAFNRQFDAFIQNGELTRADSLLRTRRNVDELGAAIDDLGAANAAELAEAQRHQQNYETGEQVRKQMLEEFGASCYQHYELCQMRLEQDSAAYWLIKRAEKDTTNAVWQFEAGRYLAEQNQHPKAIAYYEKTLSILERLAQSNPQAYEPYVATTQNNLAILYSDTQRFAEAEKMYLSALAIYERLAQSNPQAYEPYVAKIQYNLAILYYTTQRFAEAEKMYLSALAIRERLAQSNPQAYEPDVADTQNNLANLYKATQRFAEAEKMYLSALAISERLAQSNPQAYEPDVAMTLWNLSLLYNQMQRQTDRKNILEQALNVFSRLAETDPESYQEDVDTIKRWLSELADEE